MASWRLLHSTMSSRFGMALILCWTEICRGQGDLAVILEGAIPFSSFRCTPPSPIYKGVGGQGL